MKGITVLIIGNNSMATFAVRYVSALVITLEEILIQMVVLRFEETMLA